MNFIIAYYAFGWGILGMFAVLSDESDSQAKGSDAAFCVFLWPILMIFLPFAYIEKNIGKHRQYKWRRKSNDNVHGLAYENEDRKDQ